jgi:DNA repair exonuclease SbcCD ATPase subunit
MFDALGTGGVRVAEPEVSAPPLGRLLVERGHLTEEQLQTALDEHTRTGLPLGQVLISLSYVTATTVAQALATQQGGLIKTEYGLSTGFGTPGIVTVPPISPPASAPLAASWVPRAPEAETPQAKVVALPDVVALPEIVALPEVVALPVPEIAQVAVVVQGPDPELLAAQARITELEMELAAVGLAEERIQSLESELATARMDAARIPALEVDLAAARQAETERDARERELQQAQAELEATRNELAAYAADRATMIETLRAAQERVQEVEAAAVFQQPRTASPFAWQS